MKVKQVKNYIFIEIKIQIIKTTEFCLDIFVKY